MRLFQDVSRLEDPNSSLGGTNAVAQIMWYAFQGRTSGMYGLLLFQIPLVANWFSCFSSVT